MSKIDDLMKKYCPNGVEYKKIKEVFTRLKGTPITATRMKEIECEGGEIRIFAGGKTVIDAKEKDIPNANITRVPAVLVQSRGVIDFIYYEKPFTFKNEMWAYTSDNKISVKYLFYVLKNNSRHFREAASGMGALPQISLSATEDFVIPVPPLEVQREIVQVLDSFTMLTAELTAELTARKKQYEYYRDQLLSFNNVRGGLTFANPESVRWMTLGDIATVTKLAGFEFTNYVTYSDKGKVIALRGLNVKDGKLILNDVKYIDGSDFSKLSRSKLCIGDMLFTYVGTVGQVALIDENDKYYLAPNVSMIRLQDENVLPKFMMYYFRTKSFWNEQISKLLQQSSMQNIPMEKIRKFSLPIPPLAEQERIVTILDKFDALVNDLSEGLPAEIEARKRQYEYYRDKLLSFKKIA